MNRHVAALFGSVLVGTVSCALIGELVFPSGSNSLAPSAFVFGGFAFIAAFIIYLFTAIILKSCAGQVEDDAPRKKNLALRAFYITCGLTWALSIAFGFILVAHWKSNGISP